jgi:hypothetical protein
VSERALAVAAATVLGQAHVRTARNNQDGLAIHAGENVLVAVVTDGCSSAPCSEVGARLGARWLCEWIPKYLGFTRSDAELLEAVRAGLVEFIEKTALALRPERDELALTVEEFFLFTYIAAIVRPERTIVFGQGDGLVSVNGKIQLIDAGPDNAPPYPSYALVREILAADPGPLTPVVHHDGPTSELRSLVIATDGAAEWVERAEETLPDGERAGGLEPFEQGDAVVKNPSLLQQRLNLLGRVHRRLRDDTTVILVRTLDAPPKA